MVNTSTNGDKNIVSLQMLHSLIQCEEYKALDCTFFIILWALMLIT